MLTFATPTRYWKNSFARHPSYLGFFYWALGTQIMLANPVSIVVFAVVLWRFFKYRIEREYRFSVLGVLRSDSAMSWLCRSAPCGCDRRSDSDNLSSFLTCPSQVKNGTWSAFSVKSMFNIELVSEHGCLSFASMRRSPSA